MSDDDWYAFKPIKFRRKTYHLGLAACEIYRRLIDEYMITRSPLPADSLSLAGIARVPPEEFNAHSTALMAFFTERNGKLHNKGCDEELHAQSMLAARRSHKAKEAATVRWAKTKPIQQHACSEHAHSNANAMLGDATYPTIPIISLASSFPTAARARPTPDQTQAARLAMSDELKSLMGTRGLPTRPTESPFPKTRSEAAE